MKVKMSKRCTGGCCEDFILPFGPEDVERYKKRIAAGQKKIVYEQIYDNYGRYPKPIASCWDVEGNKLPMVLDMIIFKRSDWQNPQNHRGKSKLKDLGTFGRRGQPYYHYTCKHFDGRNCKVYDQRPGMCRSHGENNSCQYRGCTNKCEPEVEAKCQEAV